MQSMISGIMFTLLMRLDLIKKFFFHPLLWYRETRPRVSGRAGSLFGSYTTSHVYQPNRDGLSSQATSVRNGSIHRRMGDGDV